MSSMIQAHGVENVSHVVSNVTEKTPFVVGDVVDVQSRTWPGINKPGGTARVKSFDENTRTYCVTYMLGGKEDGVDEVYITAHLDDHGTRQRRQTTVMNVAAPEEKKKRKPVPSVLSERRTEFVKPKVKKTHKKSKPVSESCTSDANSDTIEARSVLSDRNEECYVHDSDCDDSDEMESMYEYNEVEDDNTMNVPETTVSEGTVAALALMHQAFRDCTRAGEGIYHASVIEEYITSKGSSSVEDIEACFVIAEKENKIMVDDDEAGIRSIYVI